MYDGLAFAGLYIRKEYDGPGTQKRSYSNKDILVHPGLYRHRVFNFVKNNNLNGIM